MNKCSLPGLRVLFAILPLVFLSCGGPDAPEEGQPRAADSRARPEAVATGTAATPVRAIEPGGHVTADESVLERGAELYAAKCAACHGAQGDGGGEAAYLLYPKPRNLKKGVFRFTSTFDGTPTDEDLFRAVSRGMPGSAMPSWAHLSEADRWALVHYVKSLAERALEVPPYKAPDPDEGEDGEGLIPAAPEPADTPASRAQGAELFAQNCSPCHGPRGQGDGPQVSMLRDGEGYPIRPRDLTTGVFKSTPQPELLYRQVVGGIPDTPMPAHVHLIGDPAWHVVHYVLSLSSPVLRERAEMKRYRISAERVESLPDHPDAGAWKDVRAVNLHLMPLWWRYNRPEYVTVRAAHDGRQLALLLVWADDTHDHMVVRPQDFRDAAAVQFSLTPDPPFFAMGEKGRFVNIWMWKSERQADIEGFHDIDTQYPNTGIDSYPNLLRSPYEQPMRHALTLRSDPTFVTGWGAANIVSDPTRRSAAEDLKAQGFGTLRARPRPDQNVDAHGVYGTGSYRVMLRRTLEGEGESAVRLRPGTLAPVAFAIWNGSAGDRDGKKSVTIWQELAIAE